MSDFHKEDTHKALALLFDSCKIEQVYKEGKHKLPWFVIKDKEENRVYSMMISEEEMRNQTSMHHASSLGCIAIAPNAETEVAMRLGLVHVQPQGVAICPQCLAKAISAAEEHLIVLKDIQEMINVYAAKL